MSAPTALEAGALRRGIATWTGHASKRRGGKAPVKERRSTHPVAVLSRRHDDLCRHACDPYEITAVLEAAGLDDRRARAEFGSASVFELGERLYETVPWRPEPSRTRTDPWHLALWRGQLRGLLYAVPAVTAALVPAQDAGPAGLVLLSAGTVAAIACAQALSVLGHLMLGRGQQAAFVALTRAALVLATVLSLLVTLPAALFGGPVIGALVGTLGLQLVLVVSATLLLVPGREALLAAVMLPGALAAGAITLHLVAVPSGPLRTVALPGLAVASVAGSALAALIAAGRAGSAGSAGSAGKRRSPLAPLRDALGRPEWSFAGVAALYGVGLAATVSFALVAGAAGTIRADGVDLVLVALPLTATVGTSEYLLHRARGRAAQALEGLAAVGGFAGRSRRELRAMLALHAVVVLAVTAAVVVWLDRSGRRPDLELFAGGYGVLSLGLLLSATLLSLGHHRLAARLVLLAGATLVLAALVPVAVATLLVVAGFLVVAYRAAAARFVAVTAHR